MDELLKHAVELEKSEEPFALVTVVHSIKPTSAAVGAKAIVYPSGKMIGFIGGQCTQSLVVSQAQECMEKGESRLVLITSDPSKTPSRDGLSVLPMTCDSEGTVELFIEPKLPKQTLLVVGNSPIASLLAEMAGQLKFKVKQLKMGAESDSDPVGEISDAHHIKQQIKQALEPGSYVVIATMGLFDELSLAALDGLPLSYAGLVTSPKRKEKVLAWLKNEGASDEFCSFISAPAGLDLGAVDPGEIAVTILAEIIQVKRKQNGYQHTLTISRINKNEVIDPVCGMVVDLHRTAHKVEYEGEEYGFCCPHCRQAFLKNPETYVKKLKVE